jgi:hypothetical protein
LLDEDRSVGLLPGDECQLQEPKGSCARGTAVESRLQELEALRRAPPSVEGESLPGHRVVDQQEATCDMLASVECFDRSEHWPDSFHVAGGQQSSFGTPGTLGAVADHGVMQISVGDELLRCKRVFVFCYCSCSGGLMHPVSVQSWHCGESAVFRHWLLGFGRGRRGLLPAFG